MNPAWWAAGSGVAIAVGGWFTFVAKLLWDFRGRWDATNERLTELASADRLIEQKLDLHIAWHEQSCGNWGRPAPPRRRGHAG